MTFPTIPTTGNGRMATPLTQQNTVATRTFPTLNGLTKNSGDLLLCIVVAYQATTTDATFSSWTSSFTELVDVGTGGSTMAVGIGYKISNGTEATTPTVQQTTPTGHCCLFTMSIAGWHGTDLPEVTALATGTSADADPASINPSWDNLDTLVISVAGNGETGTGGSWTGIQDGGSTVPPTNYGNVAEALSSADATGACDAAVAFRQINDGGGSIDVGPWTSNDLSTARNCALTIVIKPVSVTTVNGAGTGAFGGTFTAAGVPEVFGVATASFGGTFTAAGVPEVFGVAVANFGGTFTASGTTTVTVTGQGQANFGGTFTASGVPEVFGQAVASFGGTFTALGIDRAVGQAVASLGGTFTALGIDRAVGQAVASLGGTFTASGIPEVFGQAVAAFGGTFSASGVTGSPPVEGQGVAQFGGTFAALGIDRAVGVAAVSLGGTFTALGIDRVVGVAAINFGGSFVGVGSKSVKGIILTSFGGTFEALGTNVVAAPATPVPVTYRDNNAVRYQDKQPTATAGESSGQYREKVGVVYREKVGV